MLIKILSILILMAVVTFVVWSYMSYFKMEEKSLDTSYSALQETKELKNVLESRDRSIMEY